MVSTRRELASAILPHHDRAFHCARHNHSVSDMEKEPHPTRRVANVSDHALMQAFPFTIFCRCGKQHCPLVISLWAYHPTIAPKNDHNFLMQFHYVAKRTKQPQGHKT